MRKIAGILLAAGSSTRMRGEDKLLKKIGGESLLRRSAKAMIAASFSEVVVAIKAKSNHHKAELDGLDVEVVEVNDTKKGMSASIRVGLQFVSPDIDAVVIGLADVPDIRAYHYQRINEKFDTGKINQIIRAVDKNGSAGHPVLFSSFYRSELCNLDGDKGAKELLRTNEVATLNFDDLAPTTDLDTPEAWQRWFQDFEKMET